MKLGYIYASKVLGNLNPGGVDPYTGDPSAHVLAADLGQGGAITGIVCPLTIIADSPDNWADPSTVASDVYGLRILVMVGHTPGGDSSVLRLEPNLGGGANQATQVTLDSIIMIPVGGHPIGNVTYLLHVNPATNIDAWSPAGTPTTEKGWFKVNIGSHIRYIQLYETAP